MGSKTSGVKVGKRHPKEKEILQAYLNGEKYIVIQMEYGVCVSTIRNIRDRYHLSKRESKFVKSKNL